MARTPTGIPTDPPLTAKGVEQSKELADYLASIEPPVDRIYSSPFYRCLQTLKPFSDTYFNEEKSRKKIRVDRGIGYVILQDPRGKHTKARAKVTNAIFFFSFPYTANSLDAPTSSTLRHPA